MWSHHALLCPAVNQAWADFETHARECSNEYYVLAARAFASLRHVDLADGSVPEAEAQPWESMPWAGYAARPWWETMRRPAYTDSGGSSSGSSNRGSRSRSCSSGAGDREVGDGQAGVAAGSCAADSDGRCRAQVAGGLASQDGPAASGAGEALHSEARAGAGGDSGASVASDSSLDRYFVSKVREQTRATVELLRHALAAEPSSFAAAGCGSTAAALLDEGEEALGRLVGLLRVNVLSVQATSAEEGPQKEDVARGMAIYALTCAMNHSSEPNCFAESDPEVPQRCHVRAARAVEVGDELCIDYLAGSPYDAEERRGILRRQYSIVQAQGVA